MKDGVRARYTLEFKQEAVRLVRGGEKISAAARTLCQPNGIRTEMACQPNQLGSIVTMPRETLDEQYAI